MAGIKIKDGTLVSSLNDEMKIPVGVEGGNTASVLKLSQLKDYMSTNLTDITETKEKLIKLTGIGDISGSGITKVGDIYYDTSLKILRKCITLRDPVNTSGFSIVPFRDGGIYTYQENLYIWNELDLVQVTTKEAPVMMTSSSENNSPGSDILLSAGAIYDPISGTYSISGITGLSELEAIESFIGFVNFNYGAYSGKSQAKINFPIFQETSDCDIISLKGKFRNSGVVKIQFTKNISPEQPYLTVSNLDKSFSGCNSLVEIVEPLKIKDITIGPDVFSECRSLSKILLYEVNRNIDIRDLTEISKESLDYLISNAINTEPLDIIVSDNIFDKINPENGTWHDLSVKAQQIPGAGNNRTAVIKFIKMTTNI